MKFNHARSSASRSRATPRLLTDPTARLVRLDRMTSITAAVLTALHGAPCLADGGATSPGAVALTATSASTGSSAVAAAPGATGGSGATGATGATASTPDATNATSAAPAGTTAANGPAADAGGIQEVLVTATRRTVNAQDLPISITAISGEQLVQEGIEDIGELAQSMAGVDFIDKGPFSGIQGSGLIIRGLNSEAGAGQAALATPVVPPVATYVDDTPLYFNVQLWDLARVEILRGPQGTLYGSGSLGGTIRFVQNAPDPTAFDAQAEVGVSDTAHTHAPNEELHGMLNIPLAETLALRLDGGGSYDAGFINEPNLYVLQPNGAPASAEPGNPFSPPELYREDGTNSYQYRSARASLLWKPNDQFHVQLNYYYQLGLANGFPYVATSSAAYNQMLGPFNAAGVAADCAAAASAGVPCVNPKPVTQLNDLPVPAGVDELSSAENALDYAHDVVNIYSLSLDDELGFATLTGDASWSQHLNHSRDDLTAEYANFIFYQSIYGQDPRTYVVGRDELNDRPLTFEVRLASKLGGFFDWIAGLFYKTETQDIQEHEYFPGYLNFFNGCSAIYGATTANQFDYDIPSYCGVGETGATANNSYSLDGIPVIMDQAYIGDFETHFKDMAAFGELTAHLTQKWSLTGGTRVFRQTVSQAQQTGLLFDSGGLFLIPTSAGGYGPPPVANTSLSASWNKALWKLNTAYQLDKNNLVYATWSQGFRRGGVNALPPAEPAEGYVTPAALTKLQPDTADNYEIGVKGTLLGRLRYTLDVFDIQWHNIQEGVVLTPLVLPGAINAGNAFSRGIETEFDALLNRNWSAILDYTYDQTKLTSLNPLFVYPNSAAPPPAIGSALPGTPKNSLAVGPVYQMSFAGGELRFAVNAHYQSALLPALSATVPTVGGYTMLGARVSFARSHWLGTFYVDNLTNNLGITSYQDPAIFGNRAEAVVSQPRTFGIKLRYSLE